MYLVTLDILSSGREREKRGNLILNIESQKIDFHQLIENSLNSIFIIEKDGHIVYCNTACLEMLKLTTSKNIISKNGFSLFHPDYQATAHDRFRRIIENGESLGQWEAKMIRSDGELIDVEAFASPFYLDNQVYVQATVQNVTHRKLTEKLLSDREKLASLGQIAAGIAHEIKNPLSAVKGFLQLLKESNTHPYLDIMNDELDKALNTLQDLLQVSKPDLHEEPLVSIDLCKEIKSIITLFQERLYTIEIEMDLRDSEKKIVGKRNLFQKAFFNVIKNAIEAIKDKGIIKIEHFYSNECIHIKVSDSGVGIPKEKLKLLGTPFFTSKSDGTGLGLTQVFTTINEHNGKIFIHSEVGKGTTLHIQLPFKEFSS
jgi:two-component system, sporulation sensor kinase A